MSFTRVSPTSGPPVIKDATEPGIPLRSKTLVMILVVAMATKGVLDASFQTMVLPQTIAIALFQPYTLRHDESVDCSELLSGVTARLSGNHIIFTAMGKLNAEITPTTPKGFHFSKSAWFFLSEGNKLPGNVRDKPTA